MGKKKSIVKYTGVQPQYCVSFELDVTNFKKRVKKNWSSKIVFIFAVTKCANEIEEFWHRFLDGEVVLYESIDTLFTNLDKKQNYLR